MAKVSPLLVAAAGTGVVVALLVTATAADDGVAQALPGCSSRCGNMSIPHPFGVEAGCYLPGFNVTCSNNSELFLGDGTVQVLDISIPTSTVRINSTFAYFPGSSAAADKSIASGTWSGALAKDGPYTLAWGRNMLFAAGCNIQARLEVEPNNATSSACLVLCSDGHDDDDDDGFSFCPGFGFGRCCQAPILRLERPFSERVGNTRGSILGLDNGFGDIMAEKENNATPSCLESVRTLPAVLDWRINHTTCHGNGSSAACRSSHSFCYDGRSSVAECGHESFSFCRNTMGGGAHICRCDPGYQGNPYVPNGCKDVNECNHLDTYPCYGVCTNTDGGYKCDCSPGFSGDAYVPTGCTDIDECAHNGSCYGNCLNMNGTFECRCKSGTYESKFMLAIGCLMWFLLLVIGAPFIISKIKRYKVKRRKERYFKQNHGLLLQQLVSQNSDIGERMIITFGELEKATNNFHPSHEIGGGGHGVVYKGLLDLQVVAIKKSKIIVTILSRINHRNIVKFLGCCLETEVPLLVYEFISNGTLAHHLHVEGTISLSWDDRLRIALEISKAIAYLHSSASTQVLHRDIKSSNILLDDNLTAKVSDFGASKYIPIDRTGVTTAVQGTIGYLDPMYYYTSRLTDKSDVFSFGVLVELLTRKKPFAYRSDDGDGLVSNFSSLLAQGTLVDIIDPQIMEEEGEQVDGVARLAAKCTKLNGEDRPTMREVEMTLESLRGTKKHIDHNTKSRNKYEKEKIAAHCMPFGGLAIETSRQYTMEEEMLLSA
ncbi:hypothetical protein U9M48_005234, partial [Paspalum notatum var. saurae]